MPYKAANGKRHSPATILTYGIVRFGHISDAPAYSHAKETNTVITTVLFDLDGTLLPMDQDTFTHGYFKLLAAKLAPHGYEPKQLVEAIWTGTEAMVRNDGSRTNEAAFWNKFASIY